MAVIAATPYDSARLLFGSNIETWLNEEDAKRLAAYTLYDSIYRNYPDTFKLVMRGTNEFPIYIPSGRIIVDTLNRYVGKGCEFVPDPEQGTDVQRALCKQVFDGLFKREGFLGKFNSNKKKGLILGDAAWKITANDLKPDGTKISIETIDPGVVFPIEDPDNANHYIGVDLVEQIVEGETLYVKRQRYLKSTHPDHEGYTEDTATGEPTNFEGFIQYQVDSFEVENWESEEERATFNDGPSVAPYELTGITALPVYWWNNERIEDSPWGFSLMQGIETLIAGVNQTLSDEDLAIALQGIGMFVTDNGPPVDDEGNPSNWILGPGEVVEVDDGKKFDRVRGVGSDDLAVFQGHVKYLEDRMAQTTGASDVAQGRVDVQMAESGIALAIRLGPIIDAAIEKDGLIKSVMDQMFFDLRQWLEVYEGIDLGEYDPLNPAACANLIMSVAKPVDKLPNDTAAYIRMLFEGYNAIPAIFSGSFVRDEMRRLGMPIPDNQTIMQQIAEEAAFFTDATTTEEVDSDGQRLDEEAGDEEEGSEV